MERLDKIFDNKEIPETALIRFQQLRQQNDESLEECGESDVTAILALDGLPHNVVNK